jgi:hypothetical protein
MLLSTFGSDWTLLVGGVASAIVLTAAGANGCWWPTLSMATTAKA